MPYNPIMVALPVLDQGSSPQRLYRRAIQLWCSQVAEETGFGTATAYTRADLPAVAEANCLLGEIPPEQWPAIHDHFARAGTRPLAWYLPSPETPPEGMRPRSLTLYRLGAMPTGLPRTHPDLTIIPARASFSHVAQIMPDLYPGIPASQAQEAAMCHLDDSRVDAIVAIEGDRAVAYASVLSTGEAGFIQEFFVHPETRGRGYGRAMAGWVFDICIRSLFKQVFCALPADMPPAANLAQKYGFVSECELLTFVPA
jgi:GNAT superfamily N-acetyltransferase